MIAIVDHRGERVFERTSTVKAVAADSSARLSDIEWKVRGKLGESFRIEAKLQNAGGRTISANHYVLLIADQEKARQECRERAENLQAIKRRYPTADYYRFFSELSGREGAWTML